MGLHSVLYVAKLSEMGRLAFCQMQKNDFYSINVVIVYIGILKLILKPCNGAAYHDQVNTVVEICKDETMS